MSHRADNRADCTRAGRREGGNVARFWERVGEQLRRPEGAPGAIAGHLMATLNAKPYRLTIDALDLKTGDSVLDIGFGPGRSFALLGQRTAGGLVRGIDHSEAMLRQATRRNRAAIAAGRLELVRGSFGALPWRDGTFDKILLVNTVYFFDHDGRDMSEALRVLRPGGRLAAYATERAVMDRWPFSGPETHRTFDAADLIALLQGAGLERARIWIHPVALPFGIKGNIAVAEKAGSAASP